MLCVVGYWARGCVGLVGLVDGPCCYGRGAKKSSQCYSLYVYLVPGVLYKGTVGHWTSNMQHHVGTVLTRCQPYS
jgi:hypothetical protein